jgi:hypothetical protein
VAGGRAVITRATLDAANRWASGMHYAIDIPNFGEFADPRPTAQIARRRGG